MQGSAVMYFIKKDMSATQHVPEFSECISCADHYAHYSPSRDREGEAQRQYLPKDTSKSTGWTPYLINLSSVLCPQNHNKIFLLNYFLKKIWKGFSVVTGTVFQNVFRCF